MCRRRSVALSLLRAFCAIVDALHAWKIAPVQPHACSPMSRDCRRIMMPKHISVDFWTSTSDLTSSCSPEIRQSLTVQAAAVWYMRTERSPRLIPTHIPLHSAFPAAFPAQCVQITLQSSQKYVIPRFKVPPDHIGSASIRPLPTHSPIRHRSHRASCFSIDRIDLDLPPRKQLVQDGSSREEDEAPRGDQRHPVDVPRFQDGTMDGGELAIGCDDRPC